MDYLVASGAYFAAERWLGLVIAGMGCGALGFGAVVWRTHTGPFLWGALVPLVLIGLLASLGGVGLAWRSHQQATDLAALYERDPAAVAAVEGPRMERVNANWPRAKIAWSIVAVLCIAAALGTRHEGAHGAAAIVFCAMGVLMVVDTFGERRAAIYAEAVRALPPP